MQIGTLVFSGIEMLADNWWTSPPQDDPAVVWQTWNRDTYYVWGANSGNYQGISIGASLNGGGMAGLHGPTRGRAHPHYVGVITMDDLDLPKNDAVFASLAALMAQGKTVVIPTFHGKWSLGTGIGKGVQNWGAIQKYTLIQVYQLGLTAASVKIPAGVFWPDERGANPVKYPISDLNDIQKLIELLDQSKSLYGQALPMTENAISGPASGDQTDPQPKSVTVAGIDYTLVAFYYPDHPAPCDLTYHAGCFGNFFPCSVTLDHPDSNGQKIVPAPVFHTAEAAFQALKWWYHASIRQQFENVKTGGQAFHLSQSLANPDYTYAGLGKDSTTARLNAMKLVLKQKYTSADLQTALLATGGSYLIEHATGSHDTFWSDGGRDHSGTPQNGKNMLGRTLMQVRAALPGGQGAPENADTDSMAIAFKNLV